MSGAQKPRLLLHVGAHKTGTTAIQFALAALRPDLALRGIAYPDVSPQLRGAVADHNALAHAIGEGDWRKWLALRAVHRGLVQTRAPLTVISAEAIMRHTRGPVVAADLDSWFAGYRAYLGHLARWLRPFQATALCYLRQPETAVISLYKENVIRGLTAGALDFDGFLAAKPGRFHYLRHIAALQATFAEVQVRSYEAEQKTGLVAGFLAGIGAGELTPPAQAKVRSSPSNRATLWLQRAIGAVPNQTFRRRALFALRPEAEALFHEDTPSTLWPGAGHYARFLNDHAESYTLPFLRPAPPLTQPPTEWTDALNDQADRAFAAWQTANEALLQRREALRLRHYDADPV